MNTAINQPNTDILPANKALHGSLYITIGRALAFLASFAVVMVMGRYVPRDIAGSYNIIIATLAIISITTLPGMTTAVSRAVARGHNNTAATIMKRRLLWGLIGSGIVSVVGIILLALGNRMLGLGFLIAAPFVPLTDTFSNTAFGFWNGKKRFDMTALTTILYYFGIAACSIPIMVLSNNLVVIILVVMLAQTGMGLIAHRTIMKKIDGTNDPDSVQLGMHLTVMQITSITAVNIDRIITGILFGPAATAVYTFASTPIMKAWQLVPIGVVSLPHLSVHTLTKNIRKIILRKTRNLFFISIPGTIALILLAPFIYKLFFPLYPDSIIYFQLLAIQLIFAPMAMLRSALTAFNKTRALYIIEITNPIIKIILLVVGGIAFGLPGVAYASVVAAAIDTITTTIIFCKIKLVQ